MKENKGYDVTYELFQMIIYNMWLDNF